MYKHFFKRLIDFCIVFTALLIIWPILLVITIWLHFANKGAGAFFFQERPGKDGKIFKVIKYKTMTDEKDENGNLLPDAQRLTKVGRFVRSFINGKCFRVRMAGYRSRGKGVGKLMMKTIERIVVHEGLRLFASISPDNFSSLNSAKAVSYVRIIKTLESGYYYMECTPKQNNTNQWRVKCVDNRMVVVLSSVAFNIGKEVRYAA